MKTKNTNTNTKSKKKSPVSATKVSKEWLMSKKVRPKTLVLVAQRTQNGYKIESATMRLDVNQHLRTAVPISNLQELVSDIRRKGVSA